MAKASVALLAAVLSLADADLAVCPGEGARYEDFKCNHDVTHRVCATLLGGSGQPKNWGPKGNFWQITGQEAFQWDSEIRANHGDSWCICMWATAELIEAVGCDNVHINCEATDVAYVMDKYQDGGTDLSPAKSCLQQKCPATSMLRLDDGAMPVVAKSASGSPISMGLATLFCATAFVGLTAVAVMQRRRLAVQSPSTSLVEEGLEPQD